MTRDTKDAYPESKTLTVVVPVVAVRHFLRLPSVCPLGGEVYPFSTLPSLFGERKKTNSSIWLPQMPSLGGWPIARRCHMEILQKLRSTMWRGSPWKGRQEAELVSTGRGWIILQEAPGISSPHWKGFSLKVLSTSEPHWVRWSETHGVILEHTHTQIQGAG